MAMKPVLTGFSIVFKGDGASNSATFSFATAPVVFPNPRPSPVFSLATTLPSALFNLVSSDGQTITFSLILGVCTISWPVPVPNGSLVVVTGHMEF